MLARIKPADARLGMFVHSFEGRFSDRPFWRTQFVLTELDDLGRLRRSSIDAVIVDTDKGRPVGAARPAGQPKKPIGHPSGLKIGKTTDPALKEMIQTVTRSKREVMKIVDDVRLGRPIAVAALAPMLAELSQTVERSSATFLGILRLKARDEYTYIHSIAVSALMMNFARTLGLEEKAVADLGMAGLLHDVGKIAMPPMILNKPGPLTADEFEVMKSHPAAGKKILGGGVGVPDTAFDVCLHHHERIDGKGYPFGLDGDSLSLAAKMGAICDVYDALTSDRPYKDAWSPQYALSEMQGWSGQFDAALFHTFVRSLGIYPVGTLVRLRDTSLCIVIADNADDPTLPRVRSFYSISAGRRIWCEDVQVANSSALYLERPLDWGFDDWPTLRRELLDS